MCPQEQPPPKGQSSAHTLHGFCAPVSCTLCLTLSFQCPFPGYSCSCSSAWGLMPCLWNRAGLLGLPSPDTSAAALCARLGHWGMKGILFLTAPILPMFPSLYQDADGTMQCFFAQRPEGCQPAPLPHSHSANGPDMNTDSSS